MAPAIFLLASLLFSVFAFGTCNLASANFTPLPTLPPPIYILSDGTIDPPSAPIQRVADAYTFIGDINNTVEVQRSNIVVDGNGFTVTKPDVNTSYLMMPIGWLPGVHVADVTNVTIANINFDGCITGVSIQNVSAVTVSNNTIQGTSNGITVFSSSNSSILYNNITVPSASFATGINLLPTDPNSSDSNNLTIAGNLIVGSGTADLPPPPAPQPTQYGIWGGLTNSAIVGNNFTRIQGIAFYFTGSTNTIAFNSFQENNEGFFITGDAQYSFNNTLYANNFLHNIENVVDPFIRGALPNNWDNGTVGNYWSDYTGTDADGDGIGDTPYLIQVTYVNYTLGENVTVENGRDHYPLMKPLNLSNFASEQPQAAPSPSPTPTPSSSSTITPSVTPSLSATPTMVPSSSPSVPEFPTWVTCAVILVASLSLAFTFKKRMKID
jgi:hypothetical protein